MSVYDKSYESLLNYGGKSANFPKMSNLLESMYHLMTAVQYSSLKKEMLYPYLLNLASFTSELLQGDLIYQAAHITAPFHLPEPSLSQALAKNSFLSRAQVIQMSQNVYMREFLPKTEKVVAKLISQAVVKRQLKHVFFPSQIEFQYKQFFDFQLDFTVSFIFLLIHLFLHGCLLESFDCHRDVSFRNFQLKQLVFNAAAAGEYVTFWWPAFSFDEQCVFQARYIQSQVVDAEDLLGDSSFLEDVRIKSGVAEPKGSSFQAVNSAFGYTMPAARPESTMIVNGINSGTQPPEILQPSFTHSQAPSSAKSGVFVPSNVHESDRGINQTVSNRQNLTFNDAMSTTQGTTVNYDNKQPQFTMTAKQSSRLNQTSMHQTQYQAKTTQDQLFTQNEIVSVPGTQGLGTEAVENIVKQMTDRLSDRLEILEKMAETNKQNNIVLNQNLKKLNGDFKKLYDAVEEISKTVIQVVNKGINDQQSLGMTSKLTSKSTSLFK